MKSSRNGAWHEAVHEAGHAVMAVLLGRPLAYVRVEPYPETKLSAPTRLPSEPPRAPEEIAHLEGELMLALGGLCAERALGIANRASLDASQADLKAAARIAVLTAGRARADRAVEHHVAVVTRMLEKRAEVVSSLAHVLLENGTLDGASVAKIVPRA